MSPAQIADRLGQYLVAARDREFAYGAWDCCLFCAGWIHEVRGFDPAAEYRGRCKSKRGAYALMRRVSGGDVDAAWTRACGEPIENPLMAQVGDVVMIETDQGLTLGICLGSDIAHVAPEGLAYVPITWAQKAWRL